MIPAKKSARFNAWFTRHAERRIVRSFAAVWVRGEQVLSEAASAAPAIVVANHSSWWDALVALYLTERLCGLELFGLMDARNLRQLPFFRRIGGFGVDLDQPADLMRAVRYACSLLDRPERALWIFPQGRERPITARPLGFRPGSALIARRCPEANVVPLALRYEWGAREQPLLFASFGEPIASEATRERTRLAHERAVTRELDRIDAMLVAETNPQDVGFRQLSTRSPSAGLTLGSRILARLFR